MGMKANLKLARLVGESCQSGSQAMEMQIPFHVLQAYSDEALKIKPNF